MDKNFTPLVSIIIPVYNGANYMREAIDSALSQTYPNIEVLVINDGSTDNTEEIALSYGDKVRYFKKENGGVSSALNLGIKEMMGKYFSWLSHDDKYLPEKIERQIKCLVDNNSFSICLCGSSFIDKNSLPIRIKHEKKYQKNYLTCEEAIEDVLNRGSYNGCALLIEKTLFDQVGYFDNRMRYCQDLFMWIKLFLAGRGLVICHEKLVEGRVHEGQLTQRGLDLFRHDCFLMCDELLPTLIKLSNKKFNPLYLFAKYNAKYNNKGVFKKCLSEGRKEKKISFFQLTKLRTVYLYGSIRPFIRRVYYRLFKRIKTR